MSRNTQAAVTKRRTKRVRRVRAMWTCKEDEFRERKKDEKKETREKMSVSNGRTLDFGTIVMSGNRATKGFPGGVGVVVPVVVATAAPVLSFLSRSCKTDRKADRKDGDAMRCGIALAWNWNTAVWGRTPRITRSRADETATARRQ